MKKLILTFAVAVAVSGCASQPKNIAATSVSPLLYDDYSCDTLAVESARINRKITTLYNSLKKEADTDAVQTTVGLIIFWPALFFLEFGDGPEAAEYAQLKGEYEAIEKVAIKHACTIEPLPDLEKQQIQQNVVSADEEE